VFHGPSWQEQTGACLPGFVPPLFPWRFECVEGFEGFDDGFGHGPALGFARPEVLGVAVHKEDVSAFGDVVVGPLDKDG
jgi:hypothetical protein